MNEDDFEDEIFDLYMLDKAEKEDEERRRNSGTNRGSLGCFGWIFFLLVIFVVVVILEVL